MEQLLALLQQRFRFDVPISSTTPLISTGLIDSLQFTAWLTALSNHYGIALDPAEVGVDNFDTVAQMHAFLESQRKP